MSNPIRVQVTLQDDQAMEPTTALVLYERRGRGFATVHKIDASGPVPTLQAGKPLSLRALNLLRSKLVATDRRRGVLPERVLAVDEETLIWYEPPQHRHLAFRMSEQFPARSIGTVSGRVPCPGVVFVVHQQQWQVAAFKGSGRPVASTRLFHAPFFNVHSNREICAGSVLKPSTNAVSAIDAWSRAFFGSFFSHANYDGVVRFRGDVMALWRARLKAPGRRFPERTLIDAGLTLGELVAKAGL